MRTQPTGCSLPARIRELTPLLVGRSLLLGSHPRVGILRSRLGFADPLRHGALVSPVTLWLSLLLRCSPEASPDWSGPVAPIFCQRCSAATC